LISLFIELFFSGFFSDEAAKVAEAMKKENNTRSACLNAYALN
jgi:hypothetical protein